MEGPKVSVLMGVWNGEATVAAAIDSVLSQNFTDFEFIIVEDGSTDGTAAILRAYAAQDRRIVLIANDGNIGLTKSLNRGLRAARGRYVARQDADDLSMAERLESQVAFLDQHPEVGVLGGNILFVEGGGTNLRPPVLPLSHAVLVWRLAQTRPALAHPTVMFRADLIRALGSYNEEWPVSQDYELWTRAALHTRLANLPQPLVLYRSAGDRVSMRRGHEQMRFGRLGMVAFLERLMGAPVAEPGVDALFQLARGAEIDYAQLTKAEQLLDLLLRRLVTDHGLSNAEMLEIRADTAANFLPSVQKLLSQAHLPIVAGQPVNSPLPLSRYIDDCMDKFGRGPVAVAAPEQLDEWLQILTSHPCVTALLRPAAGAGLQSGRRYRRQRVSDRPTDRLLFVGPRSQLRLSLAAYAFTTGSRWLMSINPQGWVIEPLTHYLKERLLQTLFPGTSPLHMILPLARLTRWIEASNTRRQIHDALGFDRLRQRGYRRLNAMRSPARADQSELATLVIGSLGRGGAERQLAITATRLTDHLRQPPIVLCSDLSDADKRFYLRHFNGSSTSVVDLGLQSCTTGAMSPVAQALWGLLPEKSLALFQILMDRFQQDRPDVVHAWMDESCIVGGLAALMSGVPRVVLSTRSVAPHHFPPLFNDRLRPIYRLLAEDPRVIFLNNSAAGARSYADWLGLPPSRIAVVHNGIDFRMFTAPDPVAVAALRTKQHIPAGAMVVGTAIRMTAEKQPLLWVRTAAKILETRPDTHFLIAGSGPLTAEAQALAARLGAVDRIHFLGPQTDMPTFYAAMDLMLLTSIKEGLPNVLIEAQWYGRPVVSTDAGGAGETFANGTTGWLVATHSAAALAERVIRIIDDPTWRAEAGRTAPGLVAERFGVDRMIAGTLAAYGLKHRMRDACR